MTLLPRNISEKGLVLSSALSTSIGMMKQIGFPTLISGMSPASGCSVTLQSTAHLGAVPSLPGKPGFQPAPHATTKITRPYRNTQLTIFLNTFWPEKASDK